MSFIVVCIGVSALLGWLFEIDALKRIFPGMVTMKPNSAIGFVFCGSAMVMLSQPQVQSPLRVVTGLLAATIIALGSLTLGEYFLDWNVGIDQSLFRGEPASATVLFSGRMSPSTAFCFVVSGSAVGLAAYPGLIGKSTFFMLSGLGSVLIGIGVVSGVGQVLNAWFDFKLWNYFGMALNSAVAFILLGISLLAYSRSKSGVRWLVDKSTSWGFTAAILVMLTAAGVSWSNTGRLQTASAWVSHTHHVLGQMSDLRAGMMALKNNQRDYLILGDEALLTSRQQVKNDLRKSLETLRSLTADNPHQKPRLDQLASLIDDSTAFDEQVISVRRQDGYAAAQQMLSSRTGTVFSADIERLLDQMRSEEDSKLEAREEKTAELFTVTFLLLPVAVFLSITILSLALFALNTGIGERVKTESRLRGSLRDVGDLKAALDEHAIVATTDSQGKITFVNDKFCTISGYSKEELLGQDHRMMNSGYHTAKFMGDLWKTISQGNVWHDDVKNRAKNGSLYWVDTTIVPLLNKAGKVREYVAIRADITERKLAEEASARLAAIVNSSNDAIIGKDLNSIVTSWNIGAEKIFGYSATEMIGCPIGRIIPPDRKNEESQIIGRIKNGEIVEPFDTVRIAKDGHRIDIAVTVSPIIDKSGKIVGASKVARDITEHKRVEKTLGRQAGMIDLSPDAIIVRDLDGKINSWSRGAEALYGWSKNEVIGRVTHSLFKTRFSDDLEKITEQFEKTGRWTGELVHHAKDGHEIDVQSWWLAETNENGDRTGLLESNIDITTRKRAERQVNELNARLEQRVAERTAELEVANKELEAFSYSVSHDLRAPLRAVDGFSQAVIEDYGAQLPEQGRRDLQTIRDGAQRMGVLIDDLLKLSRLSRAPLTMQEVNMATVVGNVLDDLKSQLQGRRVEIRVGDLPACHGDAGLLNQVWVNLISNALKYTRKNESAAIEIDCKHENGECVYFVRDNGAGFNMRYVQKLFGVFQRLHRVDEFEGTGVGLAIVQRIVHRHGGRIWADAVLNQGATFYFTLQKGITV